MANDPSAPGLPAVFGPLALSKAIAEDYHNSQVARVNDHEVRMSVMHGQFPWHSHPESDETFMAIDGGLVIEFEAGEIVLEPGQLLTVPRGMLHRTRPFGRRSVNLTIERVAAATDFKS